MRSLQKITGATTISSANSGFDVYASGGYFALTLADPSTYDETIETTIINGDAAAGKRLVNFPPDVKRILYPNETVSVRVVNGAWVSTHKPARYASPGALTIFVANEGDDTNDGISAPVQTPARAAVILESDVDTQRGNAVIALKAGQTFGGFALSAQPDGGNLITLSVYGSGTATIVSDLPAITIGDNAELDIRIPAGNALALKGNQIDAADNGILVIHNGGLLDAEGDIRFYGNGPNGSAIFFDGTSLGAALADGFKLCGRFRSAFRMDEGGGRYTLSGPIDGIPDASGQLPFIDHMLEIFGANELILGTSFGPHWYSVGPSRVGGHAQIVWNGYIPGGYTTSQNGIVTTTKF